MTAITYPRQYDYLEVNFFPRKSCGTNVSKILIFLSTFGILPTQRIFLCRTLYSKLSRYGFCTNLQQSKLDFWYSCILQRLKPLLYKVFDKSNSGCYTLSVIHPSDKSGDFLPLKVKNLDKSSTCVCPLLFFVRYRYFLYSTSIPIPNLVEFAANEC